MKVEGYNEGLYALGKLHKKKYKDWNFSVIKHIKNTRHACL